MECYSTAPTDAEKTLLEASFSEKNVEKVVKLYSRIMGKKLGGEFKPLGFEEYKRTMGLGKGYRVMNERGAQLRFNWDVKLAKKTNNTLTSIDYWDAKNRDFQKPTRTVVFKADLNVVQILDTLTDALQTGTLREAEETMMGAPALFDALAQPLTEARRSKQEKQAWIAHHNLPASLIGSEKSLRARAEKEGLGAEIEIFLGNKETNSFESGLKKADKQLGKTVYADPETVFDDIEDMLSVVASRQWRTLIICGAGGVGKTYHITEGPRSLKEILGPEGNRWVYHSGTKASSTALYANLFTDRDKIIVFDEADSLLKNNDIIMMLKPILDTSGDNMAAYMTGTENMGGKSMREIEEYCAEIDDGLANGGFIGKSKDALKLPSKFKFTGGMIFISNMRADEIEQAIMSRSIFIDVHLAEQDVLKRIKTIGYASTKNHATRTKEDVDMILASLGEGSSDTEEIQYMTPALARKNKKVSVRAMQLAFVLKESGLSRWSELAALYA